MSLNKQGPTIESIGKELKTAISEYVNSVNLSTDNISVSKIIAIAEANGVDRVKLPVTIQADVVTNYGVTEQVETTDLLEIEESYEFGFTKEICQAFCTTTDVLLTKEV